MRGRTPPQADEVITDADDVLIMELRLKSGRFSSSIQVPLFASEEQKHKFIDAWLGLMAAGLAMGPEKAPKVPPPSL